MQMNDTLDKLLQLNLHGMASEFESQISNPTINELPYEHRVRLLVDRESTYRNNKRLQLLLKKAKLKMPATVEEIDYRTNRGLDKSHFLSLTSMEWISHRANLVITGPTGTGKTWLACALGNQACRSGLTTCFIRVSTLVDELFSARATNTFQKRLAQYAKYDLLILDDWGHETFSERAQHDLFELIDARVGTRSTILTSQFPMENWHDAISCKTVADAILDRIVHSSHTIKLTGESLRKKRKSQASSK